MTKTNLILLFLVFNGVLNAQVADAKKINCDSIQKAKIESQVFYALAGREVKNLIIPDNITCELGKFSFDILVNKEGEVIQANINTKISSPLSDKLKATMINAAMKSKFMNNNDAPAKQKGNITYAFKLK